MGVSFFFFFQAEDGIRDVAVTGVQTCALPISPDGLLTGELVRAALRPASPHVPRATAVAVENTHNAAGGKVMSPELMTGIAAVATQAGLGLHLDGARLWNAAAATGVPLARLAAGAGTVMVSFSKGLGRPAGSRPALPPP